MRADLVGVVGERLHEPRRREVEINLASGRRIELCELRDPVAQHETMDRAQEAKRKGRGRGLVLAACQQPRGRPAALEVSGSALQQRRVER